MLTRQLGMIPGNRVLLRAPNTPMMVAAYLAVIKAGGIAVATMPLLRARELGAIIDKARISLALCDHRLLADLERSTRRHATHSASSRWGGAANADLLQCMAAQPADFAPTPRARTMCA